MAEESKETLKRVEEAKEALKKIKEASDNGNMENVSMSDWITVMGGTPLGLAFPEREKTVHKEEQSEGKSVDEEPDIENMEFRYGCISDDKCAEINSWRIPDPYGYGKKYNASGNFLVTNEDESILFFIAFSPRADEIEYYNDAYMLIYKNEYYYIYIARGYVGHYEERSGVQYWIDKIDFLYSEAIEKSQEKPTILRLLKRVYQRYRECCKRTRGPQPIYEFTFYYNGEEI